MPYPEMLVAPMREDLTRVGFTELRTADAVDAMLGGERRSVILAINSVCGCAAGAMRPAVAMSMEHEKTPEIRLTVFAGQDLEATERAREYITGYPPSSPSVALFNDGELVWMLERHQIEGRTPYEIADDLKAAYDRYC
ncbi:MAG: BrxA/BrxB family bacilliredoxin [Gemmatimonadetes bacterium]|nr:MAG: BrxA/BrxB family bacilliredoxin [Gemmatimonadota bacterium]